MKKIKQRIWPILAIILCTLVIVISVLGITGVWIVESTTLSTVDQLLSFFDKSAQLLRDGITQVDTRIGVLAESVNSVETASAKISQNVNDKGLILTLLPTTKEQELVASAQSVREDWAAVRDSFTAAIELMQTINKLPFVKLPGTDLVSSGTLQDKIDNMTAQVEALKTSVTDFRSQVSTKISVITEVTAGLGSYLTEARSELAAADSELNSLQMQTRQLQEVLPVIFILSSIAVTLLFAWIIYTQVVIISNNVTSLRSIGSLETAEKSGDAEINEIHELPANTEEQSETYDSSPPVAEVNLSEDSADGDSDLS